MGWKCVCVGVCVCVCVCVRACVCVCVVSLCVYWHMHIHPCESAPSAVSPPFLVPQPRNELERVQLENLQFNINVSPSTYAKFYFDLRSLAEENGLLFPEEYVPLTRDKASKIEVCT